MVREWQGGHSAASRGAYRVRALPFKTEAAIMRKGDGDAIIAAPAPHSAFPVSRWKASRYFSVVLATTSGGRAGAGGCLFQERVSK